MSSLPVSLSFALYTWPYVPSPIIPIISNLSTQRLPQSLRLCFLSPYRGQQILKIKEKLKIRTKSEANDHSIDNWCFMRETNFGLFLRGCWGTGGGWRTGDWGGDESAPGKVGGRGRSMREGRLLTVFSFLCGLWGGVDLFGLTEQSKLIKKRICLVFQESQKTSYKKCAHTSTIVSYGIDRTIFKYSMASIL